MNKYWIEMAAVSVVSFVLFAVAAQAQGVDYIVPRIPTEVEKTEALKIAYKLNGNSMVGSQMIDLSRPDLPKADKALPVQPQKLEDMTPEEDAVWPKLKRVREVQVTDICTRHGMRKVVTGNSWRCRK